jgi:hypothetical protein
MGRPAAAALSVMAVWFKKPLIFVIGGPTTYALSYIVFIVGAGMSRVPHYLNIRIKYTLQSFLKKML